MDIGTIQQHETPSLCLWFAKAAVNNRVLCQSQNSFKHPLNTNNHRSGLRVAFRPFHFLSIKTDTKAMLLEKSHLEIQLPVGAVGVLENGSPHTGSNQPLGTHAEL